MMAGPNRSIQPHFDRRPRDVRAALFDSARTCNRGVDPLWSSSDSTHTTTQTFVIRIRAVGAVVLAHTLAGPCILVQPWVRSNRIESNRSQGSKRLKGWELFLVPLDSAWWLFDFLCSIRILNCLRVFSPSLSLLHGLIVCLLLPNGPLHGGIPKIKAGLLLLMHLMKGSGHCVDALLSLPTSVYIRTYTQRGLCSPAPSLFSPTYITLFIVQIVHTHSLIVDKN